MLAERHVAVRRLRIHGGGDMLRLRIGVDRLLSGADVRPNRLPPAAILVVRKLADPRPGQLDARSTTPAPTWQRAVAGALDDQLATAARPIGGMVPASANAVVFADMAELLACLGRDWSHGSLAARWWWRALGLDGPSGALRAFADTPAAVPAALFRMARGGSATAFAAVLPHGAAAALAQAMAGAFGAGSAAEAALAEPSRTDGRSPAEQPHTRAASCEQPQAAPSPSPWDGALRMTATRVDGLELEQEVLVGMALALWHRPALVRAPAFAVAARVWRALAVGAIGSAAPNPAVPAVETRRGDSRPSSVRDAVPSSPGRQPAVPPPATALGRPLTPDGPRATDAVAAALGRRFTPNGPTATDAVAAAVGATPLTAVVETQLGGLFHLVLVGQQLGLYGDFTTPARPGIALDVWDFVTLLGRRLLGRPPSDRVWRLLADLAGRPPDQTSGFGYRPPRAWRVPHAWLTPFGDGGRWRYAEHDGRLLLLHPLGFPVVDAPGADLRRELRRYHVVRAWPGAPALTPRTARQRWVSHLAAYVRIRLAVALGVPPSLAARLALRRRARVLVTDTRIDIVSALADLAIEIRVAGLDRDPGHVPAAGRSLRFHFE